MTTIATDGKSMAGDGQVHCSNTITDTTARKVFRLKDGRIVGGAGCAYSLGVMRAWLESGGDVPSVSEDFTMLILSKEGVKSVNHRGHFIDEPLIAAVGSGMDFALAAMELGASPAEAIVIASKRDVHTGGEIMVETL